MKLSLQDSLWERLHNTGPLFKLHIFSGLFGSFGSKVIKRTRNDLSPTFRYLVACLARLARQWITFGFFGSAVDDKGAGSFGGEF